MADFASRYLSEVEGGKGLIGGAKAALEGTTKDVGKTFSKENVVRSMFGGDDIFSAVIRGKMGVKKKEEKEKSPTALSNRGLDNIQNQVDSLSKEVQAKGESGGLSEDSLAYLKIIAKNSISIPMMARDVNVLRQNLVKLTKLKGGKGSAPTKADAFFLKEDEREAALEVQRQKYGGSKKEPGQKEGGGEGGGGLIDTIMSFFSGGFMKAIRFIFNPKMLSKIFSKVFLPIAIIGTLFSGIKDGFKKYQETGSFSEAIVAGLGGMLEFLTFGLFGEDTLKSLFASIGDFFKPITETISGFFSGIKDFVVGLFGGVVKMPDDTPKAAEDVKPVSPNTKDFALTKEKLDESKSPVPAAPTGNETGVKSLADKAMEIEQQNPSPPPSATSPAQVRQEAPGATPTAATPVTSEPVTPAPSPTTMPSPALSGDMSADQKITQIQTFIDSNNQNLAEREKNSKERIDAFKKQNAGSPEKIAEFVKQEEASLESYRKTVEDSNSQHSTNIGALKKDNAPSASSMPSSPTGSVADASDISSSGGGSSPSESGSSGSSPPSAESSPSAPSGSEMSNQSASVAEQQRMESSADEGSIINSPTTNNSSESQGKAQNLIADVYDTEFAKLISVAA